MDIIVVENVVSEEDELVILSLVIACCVVVEDGVVTMAGGLLVVTVAEDPERDAHQLEHIIKENRYSSITRIKLWRKHGSTDLWYLNSRHPLVLVYFVLLS